MLDGELYVQNRGLDAAKRAYKFLSRGPEVWVQWYCGHTNHDVRTGLDIHRSACLGSSCQIGDDGENLWSRVRPTEQERGLQEFAQFLGFANMACLVAWNDSSERTYAEVMARLKTSIDKAEAQ
jgi:hypothetical protein